MLASDSISTRGGEWIRTESLVEKSLSDAADLKSHWNKLFLYFPKAKVPKLFARRLKSDAFLAKL